MKVGDWVAVVSVSFTALGGVTYLVQFLVKHYLAELKPNHGTSLKDQVVATKEQISRLEARVDEIYKIILNKSLS